MEWEELDYWFTKDWQEAQNRLLTLDYEGVEYTPKRMEIFKAMHRVNMDDVKVMLMGQDPYPDPAYATGIAFHVPREARPVPLTLKMMFLELQNDLGVAIPPSGNLDKWIDQGVFLWNANPVYAKNVPTYAWNEFHELTREIIEKLDTKTVVFCFLGAVARKYNIFVKDSDVIEAGHPSPRGNLARIPFLGSRVFSKINCSLSSIGEKPIDWKLI